MARRNRKQKGGWDGMFQDLAFMGVGAYAARNPNAPGTGAISTVGKTMLWGYVIFYILMSILVVIMFGFLIHSMWGIDWAAAQRTQNAQMLEKTSNESV